MSGRGVRSGLVRGLRRLPVATLIVVPITVLSHSPLMDPGPAVAASERAQVSFRGNGGRDLPPFRISRPSTLFWTSSGSIFQLFASGLSGGNVNSQATRGWTYLAPGRYQYTVNALGNWTIRTATGTVRPQSMGAGTAGYRGNGGLDLPPFVTRRGTTLRWTSAGSIFQVFSKELSGGGVNSQAHRGSTYLSPGKHTFTVNALGSWTIRWRP